MSNDVTFSLSAAQLRVAKKVANEEMHALLQEEMCNLARRVARKYVRDNKEKLEAEAKAKLEKTIAGNMDSIIEEAMKRTHLYIADQY